MTKRIKKLTAGVYALSDAETLQPFDAINEDMVKPDPEIDRVWAEEARKRWAAYKVGKLPSVDYETVMAKHHRR